jgi:hypothetical protein
MTTTLTPPGAPEQNRPRRRRLWFVLVTAVVLAVAVAAAVWLARSDSDDVATPEPVVPSAEPAPGPTDEAVPAPEPPAEPGEAEPPATANCATAPGREYVTVGATHPCFPVMGERFLVWLGGAAYPVGGEYEPSADFSAADAANVRAVQLLMDDVPDGWFGPTQWSRLTTEGPPPVTELRASGIGPLWFGMTAHQVEATGVATVHLGDAEAPGNSVEVTGIDGAGCFAGTPPGGSFTTFTTTDPQVTTPEGITARSSVAEVTRAYGDRVQTRVLSSTPRDVTLYVVPQGDAALAFWAPGPDVGPDSPLVLFAGVRAEIDALHPQSGWCFD